MTERFTERMIQGKQDLVNKQLEEMGFKLRINRSVHQPGHETRHEILAENPEAHTEHQLAIYHQNTSNTYITMKTISEVLFLLHEEMKQIKDSQLAAIILHQDDIDEELRKHFKTNPHLSQEEYETIANNALDGLTDDIAPNIRYAVEAYMDAKEEDQQATTHKQEDRT